MCCDVLSIIKDIPLGLGTSASPGFMAGIRTSVFLTGRHHSPTRLALTPLSQPYSAKRDFRATSRPYLPATGPDPTSPALLGEERLQGCQQATGPQAAGESDASEAWEGLVVTGMLLDTDVSNRTEADFPRTLADPETPSLVMTRMALLVALGNKPLLRFQCLPDVEVPGKADSGWTVRMCVPGHTHLGGS